MKKRHFGGVAFVLGERAKLQRTRQSSIYSTANDCRSVVDIGTAY